MSPSIRYVVCTSIQAQDPDTCGLVGEQNPSTMRHF